MRLGYIGGKIIQLTGRDRKQSLKGMISMVYYSNQPWNYLNR